MFTKPSTTITVKVTPNAKADRVSKDTLEGGDTQYRIYTTSTPEAGKANKAVIALLAKELGIAKSTLSIVRGHTTRTKLIKIEHSI